jgi:hypothetical protein
MFVVSINAARGARYVGDLAVGRRSTDDEFRHRLLPLCLGEAGQQIPLSAQAGGRWSWATHGLSGPSRVLGRAGVVGLAQ